MTMRQGQDDNNTTCHDCDACALGACCQYRDDKNGNDCNDFYVPDANETNPLWRRHGTTKNKTG